MPELPPRWSAAFWFAVLIGIAVWGKGWERGTIIAGVFCAGTAQGLMAVDILSTRKATGRLGLRQWLFIAVLLAMAIVFPLTEWWRLYVVTLLPVFAIVVLYQFATPKGDRS